MSNASVMLQRLADIQIGIVVPGLPNPNVLQAEPNQPSDVSSLSCPFFINELPLQRSVASVPIASGMQYIDTLIDMMLALQRKEANVDLKYSIANALQWRDAVFAAFAQHVRLSAPSMLIVSSTNASPIQITTAVPHRFVTGDQVTIANHLINTSANGTWNLTVVDFLNFTLTGSTGNGVGGQTGTARKTQPFDLTNIVDSVIEGWSVENYEYGSTEFLALKFPLRMREMYVTSIQG